MKPHHRHRRWPWLIIPLGVLGVLVIAYVFLDQIVAYSTQKGLDRLQGTTGSFKSVHVTLVHPGYDVYDVTIARTAEPRPPLFEARRVEMRWSWHGILHGHLVRRVKMWDAHINIPMAPGQNGKPAQPPLEIARTLESVPSAGLELLALVKSEVSLVDEHHQGQRLWVHDFDATVENVATRKSLMHGLPVLVTLRGKVQRTGDLSLFLTMDPFDKGLTFAGSVEVRHLELSDLKQFTSLGGLEMPRGRLDLFASVTCKRGVLTGGVKPVLENVKVEAADSKLGDKIKALLADAAVSILSDRVPGRNAVATIIPIHGDLKRPQIELVPTVLAVLRNAFVEGLSASLSSVPPPVAAKKQGILHQARHTLSKGSRRPVRAQPTHGGK